MKQKKQYQKPKMDIYYLTHQSQLLAGSGDGDLDPMGLPEFL